MNRLKSQKNKFRFSLYEIVLFLMCAVLVTGIVIPSALAKYSSKTGVQNPSTRIAKFSDKDVELKWINSDKWNVKILADSPFNGNLSVTYDGSGNEVSVYVIVAFEAHPGWSVVQKDEHNNIIEEPNGEPYYLRIHSLDSTKESVIEWKLAEHWEYGGHYNYTDNNGIKKGVHCFFYEIKYGQKIVDTMLFSNGDVTAYGASGTGLSIRSNKDMNWLKEVGAVPVTFDAYVMQKEGDAKYAFEAFKRHMRNYSEAGDVTP